MDIGAKVTSKVQVTVPKAVRHALVLRAGDELVFRLEGGRAVIAKTPDFLELAGTIAVPAEVRSLPWEAVLARSRAARSPRQG